MGSLCTCFQGNRGLQNTGRLDFLFSMCCTALWQNTADPSNDSKAPHRWPPCCSASWTESYTPAARCSLLYGDIQRYMVEVHDDWEEATDRPVCMDQTYVIVCRWRHCLCTTTTPLQPLSPRWNDLLLWSAVSRPPAWLVGGGTGKCLSLWETLALWSHEYIIGVHCAMREVHGDAVRAKTPTGGFELTQRFN